MKTRISPEVALLLRIIDEGYERKTWHGPNLKGSLRGLTAEQAAWRPAPARHNIWEIAVHAAYWKYAVRRRLIGEKRGSFSIKGSNWFGRPEDASPEAWRADLRLLDQMHRSLREAVSDLRTEDLKHVAVGSKVSNEQMIWGIAAHDIYHAGQIQLLKRLQHQG